MAKFIYVFTKADRDALLAMGMQMIKNDEVGRIFIFANEATRFTDIKEQKINYVATNTITF